MGIVIRQSIKGTIVNYIGAFIGFLTTLFVVTKYLTQEDYGLIRVLTEAGLLLAIVGQFGTATSVFKFFPYFKSEDKKHNGFFFYILTLPFLGFLFVAISVFIFQAPIKNYFSKEAVEFVHYFYWIFPLAFFMIYHGVFETYSNTLLRIVVPKFIREIVVRVLTVALYLLYTFDYINLDWLVGFYVFIFAIAALLNLLYLIHLGQISLKPNFSHVRKPLRKSIFFFTLYMIFASIGNNLVMKIDVFMISGMMGLASTAVYNVAYFMAAIVEMPVRSLSGVATPIAAQHFKRKEITQINTLYKRIALNQFIVGSLVFLLIWINIDNIFNIIPNGQDYVDGKWVVFFIGLGQLINSTCAFGSSVLSISKHYHYTLFFTFFLAGLTVLGNYLLIPLLGISGSAIATMLAYIIYNLCMYLLIRKKIKIQPLSMGILKTILILSFVFLINSFWIYLGNPFLDGVIKSMLLGGGFFIVVYLWKISPEMNTTLISVLKKIKSQKL